MMTCLVPGRSFANSPRRMLLNLTTHSTDNGATNVLNKSARFCMNRCIDVTSDQIIFVKISVVVFSHYQAKSVHEYKV